MSIVDAVVKDILSRVEIVEPPAEAEFNPDPVKGIELAPGGTGIIEAMRPHPGEVAENEKGEELLGSYTPMSSPGVITLYSEKLASFFWHNIKDILKQGYYLDRRNLERLAYMTTIKTYTHEQFHHFADVARHLFGLHYDRNVEEALAVAHSFHEISGSMRTTWNNKIGLLPNPIYRVMLHKVFRYYQPGYRDWVHYQTKFTFEDGLVKYLGPACTIFLEKSGISLANILEAIHSVVSGQGIVEKQT